jgi:hypothetical protein
MWERFWDWQGIAVKENSSGTGGAMKYEGESLGFAFFKNH